MSHFETPRQPTFSFRVTVNENSSPSAMTSPRRQRNQLTPELEAATTFMSASPRITPVDWKSRYEALEFDHRLQIERVRLHYEHELREKVAEIRSQLKREYDHQYAELRSRLHDQYQHQFQNQSAASLNLDQSLGEQVREQVRLAQQLEKDDDERRQFFLQNSTDSEEVKRLVNKLHTEGVHVLTLSELLALRLNGVNIGATDESIATIQKLHEENSLLRNLIANINGNESNNKLIKCLADIFRCEQERRSRQLRQHPKGEQLEEEIRDMCSYQRDALAKLLSQDRLLLIDELDHTKQQLNQLKERFERFKDSNSQLTTNKFYVKFLRCENHRKSLVYQKRYLLVLLTGYEDTETYALNEIRRLTGEENISTSSSLYKFDRMKNIVKFPYRRRARNFRFRSCVRVVIAMLRMQWLRRKWAQKYPSMK